MVKYLCTIVLFLICMPLYPKEDLHRLGYMAHYARYTDTDIKKYSRTYDTLAVTGYTVTADCSIRLQNEALHSTVLSKYRNQFLPVLTLSSAQAGMHILSSGAQRKKLADTVVDFLTRIRLKKIQFDFEYIPSRYNTQYGMLLAEIKKKAPEMFISVCIAPQVDSVPKYAGFFDVRALDSHVDEFMLMSYDYHGPLRAGGPVTDVQWTEKNVRHILKNTSSEKLILGAPLYGYWWDTDGTEHVFTERGFYHTFSSERIVRMDEGTVTLKDVEKTPYRNLSVGDGTTVSLFKEIARQYGLKGIGIWRLGFER